jgi:membrane protein implicated in regulation of membrane protease activity
MTSRQEFERQHRRETFLYLTLPLLFTVGLVVGGAGIVLLLQRRVQVAIIADWMVTALICCPAILCLYVIAIVTMVAAVLVGRTVQSTERPLGRLVDQSDQMAARATQVTDRIREQVVNLMSKFSFLEHYLKVFDPPTDALNSEEPHDGNHVSK